MSTVIYRMGTLIGRAPFKVIHCLRLTSTIYSRSCAPIYSGVYAPSFSRACAPTVLSFTELEYRKMFFVRCF